MSAPATDPFPSVREPRPGPRRRLRTLLAAVAGLALAGSLAAPALAGSAPSPAPSIPAGAGITAWNTPVCGSNNFVPIDLGHGDYLNVYNEQDGQSCVQVERHRLSWFVASRSGSVTGWQYPNISSGIEWGRYTCYDGRSAHPGHGSECMRYPVREDQDGHPLTSVTYFPHLERGNVAYDIWFNRTDVKPDKLGQDDGAEVMIWLAHPGVTIPASSVCWDATIQGRRYQVMCWRAFRNGVGWNYLAYIAETPVTTLPPTWLNEVFRNAIAHGELSPDWYLTAIDFGSEMNAGGVGFAVKRYSLTGVR